MRCRLLLVFISILFLAAGCKKDADPPAPSFFSFMGIYVDGKTGASEYQNVKSRPSIRLSFSAPLDLATIASHISLREEAGTALAYTTVLSNNDRTLEIIPTQALKGFTSYRLVVAGTLTAKGGGVLQAPVTILLHTGVDDSDKFPRISDEDLLTLVQGQTFKYFWDFGHPASGMARERMSSGDLVTTGGTGFGIMAIIVGIERGFISRNDGLQRVKKIVDFLQNKATTFHGAFPHWLNGNTGAVIPFSQTDDGADLVETSLLVQGLITARQYFTEDLPLTDAINEIWNNVEWSFFRKDQEDKLYWHWSPNYGWAINLPITGWNETLITYVLAAASPAHSIPKEVYDQGFARNGAMRNGNAYHGIQLPLGPQLGGPLFFAHYSFLGLDPRNLSDAYANYWTQNTAHTKIQIEYAKADPKNFGYSAQLWGFTASDNMNGYSAHSPSNDLGVITPSAALSSFPYAPEESMAALHQFYYKLGDKIWKQYGFVDAFSLSNRWFADSYLAIDQGPIIIMIENYRSGLLWELFMSAPEITQGLTKLGFSY